jgi:predicted metalloprotease with PDZ domain
MRRSSIALLSSLMFACSLTARGGDRPPVRLELDATGAPTGVLHSHMTFPATPGVLNLAYPKWIPGEHSPSGPLSQIVRLTFTAGGVPLTWHRDDLDIFLFHVDVPEGVSEVRADLDFACVLGQEGFQSDICSSYDQLVVNWWLVVLYPPALPNDRDPFLASIRLPAGWKYNTSLPSAHESSPDTVEFGEVPLKTLVDSPLIAAKNLRTFPLGGRSSALMAISAESAASLEVPADVVAHFERMVAETEAEFGGPRYTRYNLQISLGDAIDHYTLEHFESSENRLPSTGLSDPRVLLTTATMIPHEYIHSWNGKYRTPVGLDITTYQDLRRSDRLHLGHHGGSQRLLERRSASPIARHRRRRNELSHRAHLAFVAGHDRGRPDAAGVAQCLGLRAPQHRLLSRIRAHVARGRCHHPPIERGPAFPR